VVETALKTPGLPARGAGVTPPARLLRLHRNSLVNLLVLGGTPEQRLQVVYSFHRESLVRRGSFVCIDGRHDQDRLRLALQDWTTCCDFGDPADPLRAAQHGTFFLDSVASLSRDVQRLLLAFVSRSMNLTSPDGQGVWIGRLAVGNPEHLSLAVSEGRFLPGLYDSLDKVRVDLSHFAQRVA
jgi:hypothetical protein